MSSSGGSQNSVLRGLWVFDVCIGQKALQKELVITGLAEIKKINSEFKIRLCRLLRITLHGGQGLLTSQ